MTGPEYEVSPAALGEAAAGIAAVIDSPWPIDPAVLGPLPGDVGHAGLSSTFLLFCDRWEWGVRTVVRTCADLVDELRAAEDTYRRAEGGGEDLLARVAYDIVGDPGAVGATWAEVAAAALPDRAVPDWGALGGQWADAAEDLADHTFIARALAGENPFAGQLDDVRPIVE